MNLKGAELGYIPAANLYVCIFVFDIHRPSKYTVAASSFIPCRFFSKIRYVVYEAMCFKRENEHIQADN